MKGTPVAVMHILCRAAKSGSLLLVLTCCVHVGEVELWDKRSLHPLSHSQHKTSFEVVHAQHTHKLTHHKLTHRTHILIQTHIRAHIKGYLLDVLCSPCAVKLTDTVRCWRVTNVRRGRGSPVRFAVCVHSLHTSRPMCTPSS